MYEFDGEKYKQASGGQKEWGSDLMSRLSSDGGEHVLDLGCGDGVLTLRLAEMVPRGAVLGIDGSEGMLATARSNSRPNLEFRRQDINALDFENAFDIIYSNAALHWILDHKRLLTASLRALRDGGIIAWNFAAAGTCGNFFPAVQDAMEKPEYAAYFADFEWPFYMPAQQVYQELVADAGFSAYSVDYEERDRLFADADEMTAWIDQPSIVPFLTVLPQTLRPAFRSEVIQRTLDRALQPDGRCLETFRRLRVIAEK